MKKILEINDLLGAWDDKDILSKFKGAKDHKFLDRNRTLKINWQRLHRWAPEILLDDNQQKILDIASGNGSTMEIFRHYGHETIGLDFSPGFADNDWLYRPMIESQKLKCKVHNCSNIPYPFLDNQFDFSICYGAITFFKPIEKWPQFLNEMARVSKRGFVVGVNIGPVYDVGKKHIDNWSHKDFFLKEKEGSVYKWVRKSR